MKVKTKLNVSVEFLYQRLIQTAIDDVSDKLGHQIGTTELAGVTYSTGDKTKLPARITIMDAIPNKIYRYMVEFPDRQVIQEYSLRKLTENQVELAYTTEKVEKNILNRVKQYFGDTFLGWLKSYNIKKILKKLEIGY